MFIHMRKLDDTLRQLLRDPERRRAWVHYQLAIKGESLSALSRAHGLDRTCVARCLSRPYPRMEKILADAMELTPQQLFPERYDRHGLPNRPMGRPRKSINMSINNNTGLGDRNVKKGRAA